MEKFNFIEKLFGQISKIHGTLIFVCALAIYLGFSRWNEAKPLQESIRIQNFINNVNQADDILFLEINQELIVSKI